MIITAVIGHCTASIDTDSDEQHSFDAIATLLHQVRDEAITLYDKALELSIAYGGDEDTE